jgi:hypothetical protein
MTQIISPKRVLLQERQKWIDRLNDQSLTLQQRKAAYRVASIFGIAAHRIPMVCCFCPDREVHPCTFGRIGRCLT